MNPDVASSFQHQAPADDVSTLEAARLLGLAVRSIQLMADRGELEAWKTPGGHRRISRASLERWRKLPSKGAGEDGASGLASGRIKILLIEDSVHFQNLVTLLMRQQFPDVSLHVAGDGISGLVMAGKLEPEVLMVDILLPGIDGAALIANLRTHPQFIHAQLLVITSLDADELKPYAFAVQGVPVVHKPQLVAELPGRLTSAIELLRGANGTRGEAREEP